MEENMNEQERQELEAAKVEMMQEMADQVGAEYELDEAGNKTAVRLSVDGFHQLLELVSEAAMKMSMLESLFAEGEEEDGEESEEDEDACCEEDECGEEC